MPSGTLIGPYARQIIWGHNAAVGGILSGSLKFWFAFKSTRSHNILRYEAKLALREDTFSMRKRPYHAGAAPKYGANFHAYRLPEDLSAFPTRTLAKGETLSAAAFALLQGDDIADVTRFRIIGALPTRQAWHQPEINTCTSDQPRLI